MRLAGARPLAGGGRLCGGEAEVLEVSLGVGDFGIVVVVAGRAKRAR
jgi:hypothetical protein